MKASKGNKVYTIDITQKDYYIAQGYDISDEEGNVIEYGAGKSVSYKEHKELNSLISTSGKPKEGDEEE